MTLGEHGCKQQENAMNDPVRKSNPIVAAVILGAGVLVALAVLWTTGILRGPAWKAAYYASQAADPTGERGVAAQNLIALGQSHRNLVLAEARKLLLNQEDESRYYGMIIIDGIKGIEAAADIGALLQNEPSVRNRIRGVIVFQHLCKAQPTHLEKIVHLLDDPNEKVLHAMCNAMQDVSGTYNPDRTVEWWKDWWQRNKESIATCGKPLSTPQPRPDDAPPAPKPDDAQEDTTPGQGGADP